MNTQAEPVRELSDQQIDDLWIYRDCIEAIQAGDIFAQVRSVVRAATQNTALNYVSIFGELQNALEKVSSQRAEIERLRAALEDLLGRYVALVNSGDAGQWDPEIDNEVIAARAALTKPEQE